jgi:hypothetical protein
MQLILILCGHYQGNPVSEAPRKAEIEQCFNTASQWLLLPAL